MKKFSLIVLVLLVCICLCGCEEEKKVNVGGKGIDVNYTGHKKCTRSGSVENGSASFNYDIYYRDNDITLLYSKEKVTSEDSSVLDEYEEAYKKIKSYYVGLDNYDQSVVRSSDSVENITTINYAKLDMNKLIGIEGNDNNLYTSTGLKLDTWLEFAKKFGTTCEDVEE